jgi:hypothetical protein
MCLMANGPQPGGPTAKLCLSEEPKEAMADRGPNGRMVPTILWRTHLLTNRDALTMSLNRRLRPSSS